MKKIDNSLWSRIRVIKTPFGVAFEIRWVSETSTDGPWVTHNAETLGL